VHATVATSFITSRYRIKLTIADDYKRIARTPHTCQHKPGMCVQTQLHARTGMTAKHSYLIPPQHQATHLLTQSLTVHRLRATRHSQTRCSGCKLTRLAVTAVVYCHSDCMRAPAHCACQEDLTHTTAAYCAIDSAIRPSSSCWLATAASC
jgi:hypothetical protein